MEAAHFKSNPALMKLHGDLQTMLINGIITNDRNSDSFAEWKTAFETQISSLPAHKTCSVFDNFTFLSRKELYGVGKYQVLMGLFEGNNAALSAINDTLERMAEKLDARGYDTSKLFARQMTAKFQVEVTDEDVRLVQKFVDVLHDLVIAVQKEFDSLSLIETCLKILMGQESDKQYNRVCEEVDKATENLRTILEKHGKKNDIEKSSKSITKKFFLLLSSLGSSFGINKIKIQFHEARIVIIVFFENAKAYLHKDDEKLEQKIKKSVQAMLDCMNKRPKEEGKQLKVYDDEKE